MQPSQNVVVTLTNPYSGTDVIVPAAEHGSLAIGGSVVETAEGTVVHVQLLPGAGVMLAIVAALAVTLAVKWVLSWLTG